MASPDRTILEVQFPFNGRQGFCIHRNLPFPELQHFRHPNQCWHLGLDPMGQRENHSEPISRPRGDHFRGAWNMAHTDARKVFGSFLMKFPSLLFRKKNVDPLQKMNQQLVHVWSFWSSHIKLGMVSLHPLPNMKYRLVDSQPPEMWHLRCPYEARLPLSIGKSTMNQ